LTAGVRAFWRIGTDTPDYESTDLSGEGAKRGGGRWNRPGEAAVYSASCISLACLETLVHLPASGLPLNRYLVRLDVPLTLLDEAEELTHLSAPVGWDAEPPGLTSLDFGGDWLRAERSALLLVPSVIVPEEQNLLINPAHPGARAIVATKIRRWTYDPRVIKSIVTA
jgi:RES domain-containing protein